MFFDNLDDVAKIAEKSGCSVFVVPNPKQITIKNALFLTPTEKTTITVEQVRDITALLNTKQSSSQFILINPADKLGEEAANALLKNLEEPKDNYHFVLVTHDPSSLLPTILSRSALYVYRIPDPLNAPLAADDKAKDFAKRFIVATPTELITLADELAKKKDNARTFTLEVLGTVIEILYKSYFKTNNLKFIQKIPKFLKAYENIEKNGHIKLHLVADLL